MVRKHTHGRRHLTQKSCLLQADSHSDNTHENVLISRQQGRTGQGGAGQGRAGRGRPGQGRAGQNRAGVCLEEVVHHLGAEAGGDGGAVLQAGAAVHLYQPHIQSLVHHKVIPKQLMAVGPGLQAFLHHQPPMQTLLHWLLPGTE